MFKQGDSNPRADVCGDCATPHRASIDCLSRGTLSPYTTPPKTLGRETEADSSKSTPSSLDLQQPSYIDHGDTALLSSDLQFGDSEEGVGAESDTTCFDADFGSNSEDSASFATLVSSAGASYRKTWLLHSPSTSPSHSRKRLRQHASASSSEDGSEGPNEDKKVEDEERKRLVSPSRSALESENALLRAQVDQQAAMLTVLFAVLHDARRRAESLTAKLYTCGLDQYIIAPASSPLSSAAPSGSSFSSI